MHFLGQFNFIINSQNVSPITKFTQLKELVESHNRHTINCLPFTEEGYEQGLKYIEEKYGHPSKVASSYLVSMTEQDVLKVQWLYEQLLFNV